MSYYRRKSLLFSPVLLLSVSVALLVVSACAGSPTLRSGASPAIQPTPTPYQSMQATLQSTPTPAHGTFVAVGRLPTDLAYGFAVLLRNGRILVAGFGDKSAELWSPTVGQFTPTGSMNEARDWATGTVLADGRVLVAGGSADGSAEIYDPASGTFQLTGSMSSARGLHTATLLRDGRVLVAGGVDSSIPQRDRYLATAEIYDPTTGRFATTGSMTTIRENQTATLLNDGQVLVTGGDQTYQPAPDQVNASAELYDPTMGKFTRTGSMTIARTGHRAVLLPDGRVLVVGGWSGLGDPTNPEWAEIYDPTAGKFSRTGSMSAWRDSPAAILLRDGRVLVAGGSSDQAPLTAEIFDPTTGSFSSTGTMTAARWNPKAVVLQDGRVLLVGGSLPVGASYYTAELYWP